MLAGVSKRPRKGAAAGLTALLVAAVPLPGLANTTTVFSPDVKADTRAWEYRSSYFPSDGDEPKRFAHRLHYQQAIDDTWRVRLIGQQRSIDGESLDYRYTRLEVQQQYLESEVAGWDAALRYELQISDEDDSPDRVRIAWTGKRDLDSGWQLRGNFLTGREFGNNDRGGLLLEFRAQATQVVGDARLGLELFSDMNRTTDVGDFDDQEHQLGPIAKFSLAGMKVNAGYLYGISDSAQDHNFRLIFTYNF